MISLTQRLAGPEAFQPDPFSSRLSPEPLAKVCRIKCQTHMINPNSGKHTFDGADQLSVCNAAEVAIPSRKLLSVDIRCYDSILPAVQRPFPRFGVYPKRPGRGRGTSTSSGSTMGAALRTSTMSSGVVEHSGLFWKRFSTFLSDDCTRKRTRPSTNNYVGRRPIWKWIYLDKKQFNIPNLSCLYEILVHLQACTEAL